MHRNQNVVRADTTGGQRAIVLRPHDRKGIHTCQAVSLHATREPGRSPGSDNGHYGNQKALGLLKLLYRHLFALQGGAAQRLAYLVGHLLSHFH
jgi:hypothetical protein